MRQTITIRGVQLDYAVIGNGPKNFIMIPGLSLNSVLISEASVAAAYRKLLGTYTIYLFDVRFDITEGYRVEDYAEEIAAAMEALSLREATVYGNSLGGMAAQLLALRHPELVERLILVSTMCRETKTAKKVIGRWHTLAVAGEANALAEDFTEHVFSETTLQQYRKAILSMFRKMRAMELNRVAVMTAAIETFDCKEEVQRISCPVFVIGCENDRVIGPEGSRELTKMLSCQSYLYSCEYSHAVCDEAPDFKDRIARFCGISEDESDSVKD